MNTLITEGLGRRNNLITEGFGDFLKKLEGMGLGKEYLFGITPYQINFSALNNDYDLAIIDKESILRIKRKDFNFIAEDYLNDI